MQYDCQRWVTLRWHKSCRYYEARLCQDLFNQWVIIKICGGIDYKLGNALNCTYDSYESAVMDLKTIHLYRLKRGYHLR